MQITLLNYDFKVQVSRIILFILILLFPFYFNIAKAASSDLVDSTIQSLIAEKMGDSKLAVEIKYNYESNISTIKSKEQKITSINIEQFDKSNFSAKVHYNDNKYDTISGSYSAFVLIPVAARYIKQGEVLQSTDLTFTKAKMESIRSDFVANENEIIGMQTNRQIATGTMIRPNYLVRPPVLKVNDPVNIIYASGMINLKVSGLALASGAIGDTIKVKNISSGAVLLGQIINKNTVQVGGE